MGSHNVVAISGQAWSVRGRELMSSLLVALGRIIIPYRLISLTFGMVLAAFYQTEAATITAKGVSLADLRTAVDSAYDEDVVEVPHGTASWTATLSIAKGITLQGAGNDKTVILDDLPRREPPRPQQALLKPWQAGKFMLAHPSRP